MKKLFVVSLIVISFNVHAFLDFNQYGPGYDDNDWPVWTPMYWMEEMFDGDRFGNKRYKGYPYPYNNSPYNVGAQRFDMSKMPTPDQAYRAESNLIPMPNFMTPAAQSFVNLDRYTPTTQDNKMPNPYQNSYQMDQLPSPYSSNYRLNSFPSPYGSWF